MKRSKISELDETDSRLEDFLLKMEKKRQNVRGEVANTTLEAKTAIKGEWHTCNATTHLAIKVCDSNILTLQALHI